MNEQFNFYVCTLEKLEEMWLESMCKYVLK